MKRFPETIFRPKSRANRGRNPLRLIAVAVVILSAFLLFWKIGSYPISPSIYEGLTGSIALQLLEGDEETITRIWKKPVLDQPGGGTGVGAGANNLFLIYPTALLVKYFPGGDGYTVLRIVPIIYGVLSVWLLYLLVGRLINRPAGLVAAFLLATSSWSLVYSRLGVDLSATVFFSLLCFYVFSVIDQWDNPWGYVILGGLAALATYFYLPARIVFPLIIFAMFLRKLTERTYLQSRSGYLIIMAAAFTACLYLQGGNLLTYFRHNVPGSFYLWKMRPRADGGGVLMYSLRDIFLQFTRYNAGTRVIVYERGPYFDPISRYAFLIGSIWAIIRVRRPGYRFLLLWAVAGLAPMLLTYPQFRRAVLFNPAFVSLAAVGIYDTSNLIFAWSGRARNYLSTALISAVIITAGYLNLGNYFGNYAAAAENPENVFDRREKGRREVIELMEYGSVYTDLYPAELGWPETLEYERKRLKTDYGAKTMNTDQAIQDFGDGEPPCVLYLRSGLVEKK